MRTRAFRVTSAAASAILLLLLGANGCALEQRPPEGPGQARITSEVRERLDRQWRLSDLEGIIVRPRFEHREVIGASEWAPKMSECMAASGVVNWGYDATEGLFIPGDSATTSEQLQFYWCFEKYPTVDLLTRAQIDFIYDYYVRWLIPCLESNGYNVMNAPSRRAFRDADPSIERWNPYRSLERYPASPGASEMITAKCSPTVAGVEGWSEQSE